MSCNKIICFMLIAVLISSSTGTPILKKLGLKAAAAAMLKKPAVKLGAIAAAGVAGVAGLSHLTHSEPAIVEQTIVLPPIKYAPSHAYIGVHEPAYHSPLWAGITSGLHTAKNGAISIAESTKNAVVDTAKAVIDVKSAIAKAAVLPFAAAADGFIAAKKTIHENPSRPIYKFIPAEGYIPYSGEYIPSYYGAPVRVVEQILPGSQSSVFIN